MSKYDPTVKSGECVFCAIAEGRSPAATYWESDEFMAFLAITPNTPGHTIVIPRRHYEADVFRLPDEVFCRLVRAAREVDRVLKDGYPGVGQVGLIAAETKTNHASVELVPMHGTGAAKRGDWMPILSAQRAWTPCYLGHISSIGGPRANDDELGRLANTLRAFAPR